MMVPVLSYPSVNIGLCFVPWSMFCALDHGFMVVRLCVCDGPCFVNHLSSLIGRIPKRARQAEFEVLSGIP